MPSDEVYRQPGRDRCVTMVLYFHPIGYGPGKDDNLIYVGKDKHENEDLIKYGLPQDIW